MNKTLLILTIGLFITYWNNADKPKLFVVGDSISMQYGPYLEQYLKGKYFYDRKREETSSPESTEKPKYANGGDSDRVLAYLQNKLKAPDFRPDVLLINCGLHDIKTDVQTGKKQVDLETYKQNLEQIYDLVAKKGISLVWVRTTPVDDAQHNTKQQTFHRYAADVAMYNGVADTIFESRKVPIIDLHQFTLNLGEGLFTDHVHFGEETRAKQAAYIAGFLSNLSFGTNQGNGTTIDWLLLEHIVIISGKECIDEEVIFSFSRLNFQYDAVQMDPLKQRDQRLVWDL